MSQVLPCRVSLLVLWGLLAAGTGPAVARGQEGLAEEPVGTAEEPSSPEVSLETLMRRLDELEAANRELRREVESTRSLQENYEELERKYDELSRRLDDAPGTADAGIDADKDETAPNSSGGGTRLEEPQPKAPNEGKQLDLRSFFDFENEGFTYETHDGEYRLRIRGLSQADVRIYEQGGQEPAHGGFNLPRTRLYFEGHMTRPLEYQISFQRAGNDFDVLNAYLNFRYDDRFRFRVGRFKTPYTYEFYKVNAWRLLLPERSLFNVNYALNRQLGLMGWGELFEKRLEYAVGIFDGPRNSFQDFNDSKDVVAFLNFRPFQNTEGFLKNLNVGGSVDFGNQRNPLVPSVLRTSFNAAAESIGGSVTSINAAIPFLAFNNGVVERGDRALWELHMAYFWNGLTISGAWDSGFNDYGRLGKLQNVHLPVNGYHVELGYLLTGESISERTLVDPIHPFDLRPGKFGIGALEPFTRWSTLTVGEKVFTAGLADPNLWTNRADQLDVGMNWYLNKFVRITFDWQRAMFGSPVYFAPGPRLQKTSDLYWFRFQFFF